MRRQPTVARSVGTPESTGFPDDTSNVLRQVAVSLDFPYHHEESQNTKDIISLGCPTVSTSPHHPGLIPDHFQFTPPPPD
jgi:hypothetical protein